MQEMTFNMVEHRINSTPDNPLIIYPIGDIHRETDNCDVERWKYFLKRLRKDVDDGKNVRLIGMGDFNDFAAWGDRKKIRNANMHESTIAELDRAAMRHCRELADELAFTKGLWLGLVQGNHRWDFTFESGVQGQSSDDYYAERFGCPNLGAMGYIRLGIFVRKNSRSCVRCDIVIHHGRAGGKLAGTTINQIDDMRVVFPDADIYIMGHDHRKVAVPVTSLQAMTGRNHEMYLRQHRQWLMRSGSFLRGYVPGKSSYIVRSILRPTDLGVVKIKHGYKRHYEGGVDRVTNDIHVEY